jgi:hypothetical protein
MTMLDFQLIAVRLARLLHTLRPHLMAEATPDAKSALLRSLLHARVAEMGRDTEVSVTPPAEPDGPAQVTIRLRGFGLDGVPIGLEMPL